MSPPEALEMDLSQEGPDQTFDPLHEIIEIFRVCSTKKSYCWVGEPAPWAPPTGPWSGKGPFPRTRTSL